MKTSSIQKNKTANPHKPHKPQKSPEEALHALTARCERQQKRLDSLTTQHETTLKECALLTYILHRYQLDHSGKGLSKSIIRWQDVRSFMTHASHLFDQLQHRLHISLRYAWFCLWLCTQYSFCRQRGGGGGGMLSPCTVLSYFKRERAGG